jgi:hypothetical protein
MKYMLMIFGRDDWFDTVTPEQMAASMEAHDAFSAYLQGRGAEFSGEALHASKTATTLRPSDNGDGFVITDGPFVDLKEHLGGFYIIEAADLDDAIEVAKHCPVEYGIEVRPIMEFSE